MGHEELSAVMLWREFLGTISVFNLCIWALVAASLASDRNAGAGPRRSAHGRWQLALSGVFVLGCAFRAALPRADVQRIVLHDGWISSVFVGRSVATVAELAFVAQCALLFHAIGRSVDARYLKVVSRVLVPLIAVAEACSWYAVLTTNYLGNVLEDSIWALGAALGAIGFASLWPRTRKKRHQVLLASSASAFLIYVVFNCTVDVPNYVHRWMEDQHHGRRYMSLAQGLPDCVHRWVVTTDWNAWRNEIPWMTLYFSVGVWVSIALAHVSAARRTVSSNSRLQSGLLRS